MDNASPHRTEDTIAAVVQSTEENMNESIRQRVQRLELCLFTLY